jgi:hypothetical protein
MSKFIPKFLRNINNPKHADNTPDNTASHDTTSDNTASDTDATMHGTAIPDSLAPQAAPENPNYVEMMHTVRYTMAAMEEMAALHIALHEILELAPNAKIPGINNTTGRAYITDFDYLHYVRLRVINMQEIVHNHIVDAEFLGSLALDDISEEKTTDDSVLEAVAALAQTSYKIGNSWQPFARLLEHPDPKTTLETIARRGIAVAEELHDLTLDFLQAGQDLITQPFFQEAGQKYLKSEYADIADAISELFSQGNHND